jgi:hypothetical protein
MTRVLADLPDEDIKWLDQHAAKQSRSRGGILSMIIRWYRQHIESSQ